MKRNTILAACSLVLLGASFAHAEVRAPSLYGIRPLGMGNAFVAVAEDRNVLYYNPAGLAHLERTRISGVGLHGGIDHKFFEVLNFISDNEENFSDFDNVDQEFYDSLAPYDDRWVAADVHAYSDFTRPNLGIGLFTNGRVQFKIDRGVYEPRVYAEITDDIVGVIGAGMELGRFDVRVGGALKGVWRRETSRALTALEIADFEPDEILDDLESAEPGFSMDLGMTWHREGSRWTTGAVLRDAAGYIGGEGIDTALDLGASWRPVSNSGGLLRSVLLAADLRNSLQEDVSLGNKIHLGAEVSIPVLSVRGGFNQGYPSVGMSLNIPFLTLDYALYGRELGAFPGDEGQFMHAFEVRIGY